MSIWCIYRSSISLPPSVPIPAHRSRMSLPLIWLALDTEIPVSWPSYWACWWSFAIRRACFRSPRSSSPLRLLHLPRVLVCPLDEKTPELCASVYSIVHLLRLCHILHEMLSIIPWCSESRKREKRDLTRATFVPKVKIHDGDVRRLTRKETIPLGVREKEDVLCNMTNVVAIVAQDSSQIRLLDLAQLLGLENAWVFIPKPRRENEPKQNEKLRNGNQL